MKRILIIGLLLTWINVSAEETSAKGSGGLWGGLVNYTPALEDIRDELSNSGQGTLEADQDTGWMVGLYAAGKKEYWSEVTYGRWSGEADSGTFSLELHNISASAFFQSPGKVTPLLGVGSTVIYMHREGSASMQGLDIKNNDWLWGLHGFAGIKGRVANVITLEGRYCYLWSKQSTLGGVEYDLGDAFWLVALGLQFGD